MHPMQMPGGVPPMIPGAPPAPPPQPQQNPAPGQAQGPIAQAGTAVQPQGQPGTYTLNQPVAPMAPLRGVGGVALPAGAKGRGRRRSGALGPSPFQFLPLPWNPFGLPQAGANQTVGPAPGAVPSTGMVAHVNGHPLVSEDGRSQLIPAPGGYWVFVPNTIADQWQQKPEQNEAK